VHGGETPLRHSRAAEEIGRDELASLLSDVEPNGRGFGDDDPWLRNLHADRATISARWTACLTRVRVPVVCLWPNRDPRQCLLFGHKDRGTRARATIARARQASVPSIPEAGQAPADAIRQQDGILQAPSRAMGKRIDDQRRRVAASTAAPCLADWVAHGRIRLNAGASARSATSVSCATWARNQ
jgi:hypothetical protein